MLSCPVPCWPIVALAGLGGCFFGGGPNPPPDVRIVAPADGTAVSGSDPVQVMVELVDQNRLALELYVDGERVGQERTFDPKECESGCMVPIPWDILAVSEGPHGIRAVARDAAGNLTDDEITLDVVDLPLEVAITTPEDGAVVDAAQSVNVDLTVTDDDEVTVDLSLEGRSLGTRTFASRECEEGCTASISWETEQDPEGPFEILARGEDVAGEVASHAVTVNLEDVPALTLMQPLDGAILSGVGRSPIVFEAVDHSALEVSVTIDGMPFAGAPGTTGQACMSGCAVELPWITTDWADGIHEVSVLVQDPLGHEATAIASVQLADIPFVSAIEVTNEDDGIFSVLETEVHIFDADGNVHLGCSGGGSGLKNVDYDDTRYTGLIGFFEVGESPHPLTFGQLSDRDIFVQVVENDSVICPDPPSGGDDIIGTSATFPGADLLDMAPMQFEDVVHLELLVGRPFVD